MIEEKVLNIDLIGKDGITKSTHIQRHNPQVPMQFTKLATGHFIFCQNNHPIIVNRNGNIVTLEAKDIELDDGIWVDNRMLNKVDSDINMDISNNYIEDMIDILFYEKKNDNPYIIGEDYNIRFTPNFLNFDKIFIVSLLSYIKTRGVTKTRSFNLLSQLKMLSDIVKFDIKADILEEDDKLFFSFKLSYYNINGTSLGYFPVIKKVETNLWEGPVYDIKTNSNEFMIGCVQTHNSFHTGGSVKFDTVDIQKELITNIDDNLLDVVKKSTHQNEGVENILYLDEEKATLYLDSGLYEGRYKIIEEDDGYILPIGIFDLTIGENFKIPVSISREVKVFKSEDTSGDLKTSLTFKYKKGDKMFHATSKSVDFSEATKRLDEMISGKLPTKNIEILYGSFYNTMAPISKWDSVHLEVLISNCLRSSKDPQLPARLKRPFSPQMFPIKQLPAVISWPLGISFENFGNSLEYGMISDRGETSEIEKVILGEMLSVDDKSRKK